MKLDKNIYDEEELERKREELIEREYTKEEQREIIAHALKTLLPPVIILLLVFSLLVYAIYYLL